MMVASQGARILLVDDDSAVRTLLRLILQRDGHHVQAADNGRAALALFAPHAFDLVITDFCMPEMPGDELIARIQQLEPDQPIIMVTSLAEDFETFSRPFLKLDALLPKPFHVADFRDAVAEVLARRPPARLCDLPGDPAPLSAGRAETPPRP